MFLIVFLSIKFSTLSPVWVCGRRLFVVRMNNDPVDCYSCMTSMLAKKWVVKWFCSGIKQVNTTWLKIQLSLVGRRVVLLEETQNAGGRRKNAMLPQKNIPISQIIEVVLHWLYHYRTSACQAARR